MSLKSGGGFFFSLFQFSDIEKLASFSPKIAKLGKYKLENKNFQIISFFSFLGAKTQKQIEKKNTTYKGCVCVCVHI